MSREFKRVDAKTIAHQLPSLLINANVLVEDDQIKEIEFLGLDGNTYKIRKADTYGENLAVLREVSAAVESAPKASADDEIPF